MAGKPDMSGRIGTALFLLVGVCTLIVAAYQGWRTISFLNSAERAQGVTAPDTPGGHDTITGHPLVDFRTKDGRTLRYRQNGFGPSRVGVPVTVFYENRDPIGTARLGGFLGLWLPVLLPLAMGLGFVLVVALGGEISIRPGRW